MSFLEKLTEEKKDTELLANEYLKGIIDFVKWTSTIVIAAIIWLGSNLTTIKGTTKTFTFIGIISLLFSLILAISIVNRVLDAWANKFVYANGFFHLQRSMYSAVNSDPPNQSLDEAKQRINETITIDDKNVESTVKALGDMQRFSIPDGFKCYIKWHVFFIILGLTLYVVAQALNNSN